MITELHFKEFYSMQAYLQSNQQKKNKFIQKLNNVLPYNEARSDRLIGIHVYLQGPYLSYLPFQNLNNVIPFNENRDDKLGDIHLYLQGITS